jgi:hypothetical protein
MISSFDNCLRPWEQTSPQSIKFGASEPLPRVTSLTSARDAAHSSGKNSALPYP